MSRLSPDGRITLPKKLRSELGIEPGEELIVTVKDGELVIRRPSRLLEGGPPKRRRRELGLTDRETTDIAWAEHVEERFGADSGPRQGPWT